MKPARIVFNLIIIAVISTALFASPAPARAAGATITVTGTADNNNPANLNGNGTCDLREALQAANNNGSFGECPAGSSTDTDTIAFNIPGGGIHMISLVAPLIFIDDAILDGTTQPGYAGSPLIRLDGGNAAGAGWGMDFSDPGSSHSTVKGLMLTGNLYGAISITTDHITVVGNYIGTDGVNDLTAGDRGILLSGGDYAQIGGPTAAERNIVAGVGMVDITLYANADHNVIQGNYLGVAANGSTSFPAIGSAGIVFSASFAGASDNHVIGNVISGHTTGIAGYAASNVGDLIQGNRIGTNAAGTAAVGNSAGIALLAGAAYTITGNLISGNGNGILVQNTTTNAIITGNKIGTNATGMAALPNANYGIWLQDAPAKIGDNVTPGNNLISGNASVGIYMNGAATSGTTIFGNKIGVNADGSAALGNGNGPNAGGIYITQDASAQIARNWIADNLNNGLLVYLSGTVSTGSTENCFTGNLSYGVSNTNPGATLPLSGNFWGSATGPHHPINYPNGQGDEVSDRVNATPFLTTPPATCTTLLVPGSLKFGSQLVGAPVTKTLTLSNTGTSIIHLASVTTTAPFSILGTGTCPVAGGSLAAGASCTVRVRFTPTAGGAIVRNLTIASGAPFSPYRVKLSGTGVAGTELLKNPGFETDANSDNKPDAWFLVNFNPATDRRDCTVHQQGLCSLKLAGNGLQKTGAQTILKSGVAGDDFTFSLWSRSAAVPAGSVYRLQVQYFNGATVISTQSKSFVVGTHAFARVAGAFTAPGPYTKIVYKIFFKASSGAAWFDTASLRWAP